MKFYLNNVAIVLFIIYGKDEETITSYYTQIPIYVTNNDIHTCQMRKMGCCKMNKYFQCSHTQLHSLINSGSLTHTYTCTTLSTVPNHHLFYLCTYMHWMYCIHFESCSQQNCSIYRWLKMLQLKYSLILVIFCQHFSKSAINLWPACPSCCRLQQSILVYVGFNQEHTENIYSFCSAAVE